MNETNHKARLDWKRLYGFEQVAVDRTTNGRLGAKVGSKNPPAPAR